MTSLPEAIDTISRMSCNNTNIGRDIVFLNVGGTFFTTSKDTLTKDASSMLTAMFNRFAEGNGADNMLWTIDRDGDRFRHVLNYLRCGTVHLGSNMELHEEVLEEAHYYVLNGLVECVLESLQRLKEEAARLLEDKALMVRNVQASLYYQQLAAVRRDSGFGTAGEVVVDGEVLDEGEGSVPRGADGFNMLHANRLQQHAVPLRIDCEADMDF